MESTELTNDERYRETRRVTVIGAILDLALGVAKIVVGLIGHSQGLVADGVHSLSDLATDAIVIWAAKHGTKEADPEHPYGHERIQTVATVLLGLVLIAIAVGIAYDAATRLFNPESLSAPKAFTLVIAAISIVSKEGIYHYTVRVARRIRSKLLKANAWHSRSDALSSIVVLLGILGAMAGLTYLDAVAAVIVAVMIAHVAWRLGWDSLHELIDTGLEKAHLDNMRKTMMAVEGVRDVHQLRTRRMGPQVLADVHVTVDPDISVSEGHRISDEVQRALLQELEETTDVTVHIDPEDDTESAPSSHLPLRGDIIPRLREQCAQVSSVQPQRIVLHYLRGKINLELWLDLEEFAEISQARQCARQLEQTLTNEDQIGKVAVTFS